MYPLIVFIRQETNCCFNVASWHEIGELADEISWFFGRETRFSDESEVLNLHDQVIQYHNQATKRDGAQGALIRIELTKRLL